MQGKELLKIFKELSEHYQNTILVDAYKQIADLHERGKSFDSFTWKDCELENNTLTINAVVKDVYNEDTFHRNLKDYAGVIYCLSTGSTSAEAMSWDAGRKIKSAVLREIVLTICGRNNSIDPLLYKLRSHYVNEDKFFSNYTTVDEKEGYENYKRQQYIKQQNQYEESKRIFFSRKNMHVYRKPWYERIMPFIVIMLLYGGYHACSAQKKISSEMTRKTMQRIRHHSIMMKEQASNIKVTSYRSDYSGTSNHFTYVKHPSISK